VHCKKELDYEYKRITIWEVANMLGISFRSVQSILKDNLNMHQTATKFVPCRVRNRNRIMFNMSQDFRGRHERDSEFLPKIITGDWDGFMGMT
jgi:hypothetical protein